jgi:excisionase family DNA binding protein
METAQSLDIVSIASKVWAALDPMDPKVVGLHGGVANAEIRPAQQRASSLEELAALVSQLAYQLDRSLRVQQHLERHIAALEQQLGSLPACLVRLERGNLQIEARLAQLDGTSGFCTDSENGASDADPWLSLKEVAQQLSLTESTVRRYIREGRLPASRLPGGRGLRINWSLVEDKMPQIQAT